jgi:phage baseplate assembly protein W
MSVVLSFPLLEEPPPPQPVVTEGVTELYAEPVQRFQEVGLLAPFRRDQKRDFVSGAGEELVRSAVRQVLFVRADDGRSSGELPWRPEFGSLLYRLQYLGMDEGMAALLRHRVVEAIATWEPRVRISDVQVSREFDGEGKILAVARVVYSFVQPGTGNVLVRDAQVDVPLLV